VVRRQRPALFATYSLLLGCTPLLAFLALATTAVLGLGAAWWMLATVALLAAARTGLALELRRCYGVPGGVGRALASMLAGEALIVASSSQALWSAEVEWRGRRFYVGARGALQPVASDGG